VTYSAKVGRKGQ